MTIKEIEERCGMDRASIRFYEREGLLMPERLANGYRDYSERDAQTLLRIKLLRSLHVPLDEIRAMQRGERSLADAMRAQLSALEAEKQSAACAESVCRAIETDRAQFDSLDADKYLKKLAEDPAAKSAYFSTQQDALPQLSHPWRRFLARSLDLSLCLTLWELVFTLGARINPATNAGRIAGLASTVLGFLTMLFLEPLFLRLFAATPGKLLFGLRLTNADGERLAYAEGLSRTWQVIRRGYGFNIPIYRLVRLWKCYQACAAGEPEPWDDFPLSRLYTIRDTKPWRGFALAAAHLLLTIFSCWIIGASRLPPNRGDLTIAQFAENYNYLCRYYDLEYNYMLTADGSWSSSAVTRQDYGVFYIGSGPKDLTYTTNGDLLTGISVAEENCDLFDLPSADTMMMLALSMIAAEPSAGAFSGAQGSVIEMLSGMPWNEAHCTWGGVTVDYTPVFSEDVETLSYRFEVRKTV